MCAARALGRKAADLAAQSYMSERRDAFFVVEAPDVVQCVRVSVLFRARVSAASALRFISASHTSWRR